ncbi:phosphotransferase family protein [Pseudanabaena sp. PCC 6802]|uniref:phosphotransferase family protein n=1 Tax=Pseudanabaena sp. PCC 6802 TaxID=118173 RepID=UPI00034526E9|nr:phosphotransferase [Pseudanabaena sp. PCC 6802]
MTFSLSSQNVFDYLRDLGLCEESDREQTHIEPKIAKNFNLLLSFPNRRKLLVKQERVNPTGKRAGEFLREWRFHKLLEQVPRLYHLRSLVSELVHFNEQDSVIAFNYLDSYRDLSDFYLKGKSYPTEVATVTGVVLASIHRATFNCQEYRDFMTEYCGDRFPDLPSYAMRSLDRLSPEIFGQAPADAIKFFVLYQRYDSLSKAISEAIATAKSCCVIHSDLKLSNILLDLDWDRNYHLVDISGNGKHSIVRAIDWERSTWGDPAWDLGALIASYLQLWLSSLVVSKSMSIEESLRLATIPLEKLQPSIAAFTEAYLKHFPELIEYRPDFLKRIVQFAGLSLIEQIQAAIQYQKTFGNAGICTLQVAKSLLCRPEQSIPTIFGEAAFKLSHLFCVPA